MAIVFRQLVAASIELPVCTLCRQEHRRDGQEQVVLVRPDLVLCESCIVTLYDLIGRPASTPLLDPDVILAPPQSWLPEDLPKA